MTDPFGINAAVMCAWLILANDGIDLKMPRDVPVYLDRAVTAEERAHSGAPSNAVGLFFPVQPHGFVIADMWDVLVHESVHFLEFENHLPLREDWAYMAQAQAYQCEMRWQADCPAGLNVCQVMNYRP